jgi:hypothetical protein
MYCKVSYDNPTFVFSINIHPPLLKSATHENSRFLHDILFGYRNGQPFLILTRKADMVTTSASPSANPKIGISSRQITPRRRPAKCNAALDEYLEPSGMSFVNARIDGDIALDNKVYFYINTSPGTPQNQAGQT